jgi:UDP-2,4-diacetamido-2,4,6-trideoxy-beta-L-altropyranose hydrolase
MHKQLIVRADATKHMGTGHLMRCLALAQALRTAGFDVTFITVCKSNSLHQRILNEDFQVILLKRSHPDPADWQTTAKALQSHPNGWVVLDGYNFDSFYQRSIKEAGCRLLVIDDMAHLNQYCCDILLNQNINAEQLRYTSDQDTRLLLGPRYALLRTEFLDRTSLKRNIPDVARRVLVTLGGEDSDNQTLKVIQAIQQVNIDEFEAMIVVGSANPHLKKLQTECRKSPIPIRLIHNAFDMAELMASADMAVSAGGSTCWELAFMGLPTLIIILSDNQRIVAEGLEEAGTAVNLGWYKHISQSDIRKALEKLAAGAKERVKMARRGRELVDGKGTKRLLRDIMAK